MKLNKTHKLVTLLLIIAAVLVIETMLRPSSALRYNGVQIYDAIRDFRNLNSKGFDVTVKVIGKCRNGATELEGRIVEVYTGWFILKTGDVYHIVEGPMGSKGVLADQIYFTVMPPISVEAIYQPESGTGFGFKPGFRRFKGSVAFENADISVSQLQELRNVNEEFYSLTPNKVDIYLFGSGFIMDVKSPVEISQLEALTKSLESSGFSTGFSYYYTGADNEKDLKEVIRSIEDGSAALVNYYKPL